MVDGITKEQMEESLIKQFILFYNFKFGKEFQIQSKREMPDYIIKDRNINQSFGVELTLAIFNDKDNLSARKLFQREDTILSFKDTNNLQKYEISEKLGFAPSSGELPSIIEDRIRDKVEKSIKYSCEHQLILVIGIGAPMFGLKTIRQYVLDSITVPGSQFHDIWICVYNHINNDNGIISLT